MAEDFNPATHVRGANGEAVEITILPATFVAAGLQTEGVPKTALAAALERAMVEAVDAARQQGVTDPDVVKARILMARDKIASDV